MKRLIIAAMLLAGCVHNDHRDTYIPWTSHAIVGPDGTRAWAIITCEYDKGSCYEAAAATCKHGYDVADDTNHTTVSTHGNSQGHAGIFYGNVFSNSSSNTSITEHFREEWLIHCRDALPQTETIYRAPGF